MTSQLMAGKKGLVVGVANDHSIAWGIAEELANAGAQVALSYQSDILKKRVDPLAASIKADVYGPCDVEDADTLKAMFADIEKKWGGLDFLVHAVAYSDKNELKGKYADTTRENFLRTMHVSCFSFTEMARLAAPMMKNGGSMLTLSYLGADRVIPNYNVMGVAKAALEASVRYLAADYGREGIRVNAISAGPVRTLAGAGISDARFMFNHSVENSPLRKPVTNTSVGKSALYLLSDMAESVTGEIHYVDSGYNIIGMPRSEDLNKL